MIQAFLISPTSFGTTQQYFSLFDGRPSPTVTRTSTEGIVTAAGTFRRLSVRHTAPGIGHARTWALYVNGVATSLSVTVNGASTSGLDPTHEIAVVPGDTVCLSHVRSGGAPDNAPYYLALEFESADTGVSIYGCASGNQPNNSLTTYAGAVLGNGTYATAVATTESLIGPPGTITDYRVDVVTAPGAGRSREYALVLNGVVQDGSGGTPDTRGTIADAATAVTVSGFTLNLTTGDRVAYQIVPTGSPTNSVHRFGSKFTATTDGQYMLGTMSTDAIASGATEYNWVGGHEEDWTATEADRRQTVGLTNIRLANMYVRLSAAPTGGSTYTFTARRNGSDTLLTLPLTTQTGSVTANADLTNGDLLTLRAVQSGSADGCSAKVVFWATPAASQIIGSTVFGVNTTVTATRAFAVGLDGNTNIHNTPGQFKIFGDFAVTGDVEIDGTLTAAETAIADPSNILHRIYITEAGEMLFDSNGNLYFTT